MARAGPLESSLGQSRGRGEMRSERGWAVAVVRWAVAVVLQPLKEAASTLKNITAKTPNFVALVDSR